MDTSVREQEAELLTTSKRRVDQEGYEFDLAMQASKGRVQIGDTREAGQRLMVKTWHRDRTPDDGLFQRHDGRASAPR